MRTLSLRSVDLHLAGGRVVDLVERDVRIIWSVRVVWSGSDGQVLPRRNESRSWARRTFSVVSWRNLVVREVVD